MQRLNPTSTKDLNSDIFLESAIADSESYRLKNMPNVNKSMHISAIRAAFKSSLPIMAGFLFLGASYGMIMNSNGFAFYYPMITSTFIFAGSMEFLLANFLLGAFNPLEALLLTLMINARHVFYGISMIDRYKGLGWRKIYMVFGLCDETFSINCSTEPPLGTDRSWYMFYVTLFDHVYWIFGATLGGIFGSLINFSWQGIDFAMTAMFIVILLEQILSGKKNIPSVAVGIVGSLICLFVFGKDSFIIPSMLLILVALSALERPIDALINAPDTKKGDAK